MKTNCSWTDKNGVRRFGKFLAWDADNEYAKVRFGAAVLPVHKSKLTFECG